VPFISRVTAHGSGLFTGLLILAACSRGDSITDQRSGRVELSAAYGQWSPSPGETCTKRQHDRYSTVGPDGKRYPTWHPAVDPISGCTFGHDHGRDPRGSRLYHVVGEIPFGLAAQAMRQWDPSVAIIEPHGGHRITWENGVALQQRVGGSRVDIGVRCDFLMKIHRGGGDSLHELAYHALCDDGTEIHATSLVRVDDRGNSSSYLTTAAGARLAFFDPGFGQGERAHGAACGDLVSFNQTGIYNPGGPASWYTDPTGGNGRIAAFPGSVWQQVASVNNDRGFAVVAQPSCIAQ
jgi:hypothetical protein